MGWIADLHQSRGEQPGRSDTGRSLPSIGVWAQALLRTLIRGSARKWQQRSLPSLIFANLVSPPRVKFGGQPSEPFSCANCLMSEGVAP